MIPTSTCTVGPTNKQDLCPVLFFDFGHSQFVAFLVEWREQILHIQHAHEHDVTSFVGSFDLLLIYYYPTSKKVCFIHLVIHQSTAESLSSFDFLSDRNRAITELPWNKKIG